MPETPAQMPMAFARSRGGNVTVMIDSVPGIISAATHALERAGDDQLLRALRETAGEREDGEDRKAGQEHPLSAVSVTENAAGQQQRGEREHVGVDHPLQLGEPGAEIHPDRRQGDVDDGVVEHRHRQGEAHREQDDALLASVLTFESEHPSPSIVSSLQPRLGRICSLT